MQAAATVREPNFSKTADRLNLYIWGQSVFVFGLALSLFVFVAFMVIHYKLAGIYTLLVLGGVGGIGFSAWKWWKHDDFKLLFYVPSVVSVAIGFAGFVSMFLDWGHVLAYTTLPSVTLLGWGVMQYADRPYKKG